MKTVDITGFFKKFCITTRTKDSPLLTLDNFSATPHIGGNTQEALYRTGMAVVQNVLDVLDGKPVSSMII